MSGLYSNRVLELAAAIPHEGRLASPDASATKVSRICGSVVTVDLRMSEGRVSAIGIEAEACALGQAAAAVLGAGAIGATAAELAEARDRFKAMLKENAGPPDGRFAELRYLAGVADYPPRHASSLLAFEAAAEAAAAALAASGAPA